MNDSPCGTRRRIRRFWTEENLLEGLENGDGVGEDSVGEEEGVEEVDVQESEIGQTLKKSFWGRVSDLRNLKEKTKQF